MMELITDHHYDVNGLAKLLDRFSTDIIIGLLQSASAMTNRIQYNVMQVIEMLGVGETKRNLETIRVLRQTIRV